MSEMKIIFLDIDGVLVNRTSLKQRSGLRAVGDPVCVSALNYIIAATNAKIVLSSSWRFCGLEEMRLILKHWGVVGEMIDMTPDLTREPESKGGLYIGVPRGREIQTWLDSNSYDDFIIIDDDADMEHLSHKLYKTKTERGLTYEDAKLIIAALTAKGDEGECLS